MKKEKIMRHLKKKNITPRVLSLEEIIRQQEMAKYGQVVSIFQSASRKFSGPTLVAEGE